MLSEQAIFGCNIESNNVYWECNNCKYINECSNVFKIKLMVIGLNLIIIKQDEIFVKIKDKSSYIGFKSKYDLKTTCDILKENKDKPYDFILNLF